jgi:hypothetical protein
MGESLEAEAWLAAARAAVGDTQAAREAVALLEQRRAVQFVSGARISQVHAALGDTRSAAAWLATAEQECDPNLLYLNDRRAFGPLIGDPEFTALATRMGLVLAAPPAPGTTSPRSDVR